MTRSNDSQAKTFWPKALPELAGCIRSCAALSELLPTDPPNACSLRLAIKGDQPTSALSRGGFASVFNGACTVVSASGKDCRRQGCAVILSPWRPESVAGSAQHFIGASFQDCGGVGFSSLSVVEPQCPTTSRSYSRYHLPIHNRIGLSLIWRAQLNGYVGGKIGRQDELTRPNPANPQPMRRTTPWSPTRPKRVRE